jgi:N-acetylneuraminate synthase
MSYFSQLKQAYIIAEIGVNHNGSLQLAKEMIDLAIDSGADAVKFQTFTAADLVTPGTEKVNYQSSTTNKDESHYAMLEKLELSYDNHHILKEYCDQRKIDFLSTPYDEKSVNFLEKLDIKLYKIASADIVDHLLLDKVARTQKPVILSVGMATLDEIDEAIEIFKKHKNNDIVILHCVSNYPCSNQSINLSVLQTLQSRYHLPIGYSDHSIGSDAAFLSIAFNSKVIEKHFTSDKSLDGPDHKASSDPNEFKELVEVVRRAEMIMGSSEKSCQDEEHQMSQVSRKSITLKRDLKKGHVLQKEDIVMMRPGEKLPAREIKNMLGKKIKLDLNKNHQIEWNEITNE